MSYRSPKAKFKAWILGTGGEIFRNYLSIPYKSDVVELEKFKESVKSWRMFPVSMALIYDLRRTNDEGEPVEIGRLENGRFIGI